MSDTTFAPGPWLVSHRMLTAEVGKEGRGFIAVLSEDGGHIADVFPFGGRRGGSDRSIETHRANAALMAASPDLHDAAARAEYAIRVWDVDRDALSEEGLMVAHKALVAALAKASPS